MDVSLNRFYQRLQDTVVHFYQHVELHDTTGMSILGVLIGLVGGAGAIGFRELLDLTQTVFFGVAEGPHFLEKVLAIPWYFRVMIPISGGLVVGLITHFLSEKVKGHGVPEVLESIVVKGGAIQGWIVPLKAIASAVSIGSGGSAGREGPIVQIGSAFGSGVGQFLRLDEVKVQTLIGCGASAGIAGTFNAPLAGILFSLEILMEDFHISHYLPVVLSSVISAAFCQSYFGPSPAFPIPPYSFVSPWEFGLYGVLGVCAGLLALVFVQSLYSMETWFERLPVPEYMTPAVGGGMLGILALQYPSVYGVGYHVIEQALNNEMTLTLVATLFLAKILATNLTLGSGGSGGVFAPCLFTGSILGLGFGKVVHLAFPGVTSVPSSYAVVGMGSVFAGAAHAPMTAIVILFEMTRDYHIILPLILSCAISIGVTSWLQDGTIYTMKLLRRGIRIREGKEVGALKEGRVRDAMKQDVISVDQAATADDIHETFVETHHTHFPVTARDNGDHVVGMINYTENWSVLEQHEREAWLVAQDLAKDVPTVREEESLDSALEKLAAFHVELLPVVNEEEGLVGVLSRNDIINAYNRILRSETH